MKTINTLDTTKSLGLTSPQVEYNHRKLRGNHRLSNVVNCLSKTCPWTQSITTKEIMSYLLSEVRELEKELQLLSETNDCASGDNGFCNETPSKLKEDSSNDLLISRNKNIEAMVSELGDVLFDALLLEATVRREYGLSDEEAWEKACEKVERRTPYMKEWGDGKSVARNREEAISLWNEAKNREKSQKISKNLHAIVENDVKTNFFLTSRWLKPIENCTIHSMVIGFVAGLLITKLLAHLEEK